MYELNALEKLRIRLDALRSKRATRSEIEERQKRRLEDLLDFVRHQSRFYRHHYQGIERPIADLKDLPPATKPMLMEHWEDVVTDPAVTRAEIDAFVADKSKIGHRFLDRYPVRTTSGTTGEPGIFMQDDHALAVTSAVSARWLLPALLDARMIKHLAQNNFRTAEIVVGGGHYVGASVVAMLQREHPFLRNWVRLFSPMLPISELVADLNEYQPAALVGYSTVLGELGREQREGRLELAPAFITPTAEPISAAEKRELGRAFGCSVRELYAATEFLGIAFECEQGSLHANADWVILEPVDEDYQPVEPGQPSDTVLLTNLANRIQPLVRYDLGDSVTMVKGACPCGSPFPVIEVQGRQGDILHLETAEGEQVPVFPLAISTVVEEVPGVHRTQIIQTNPRSLRVRLEVAAGADEQWVWEQVKQDLQAFLRRQGIAQVHIEKAPETPKRDPTSEKLRHVWSEAG
jgi:phenylacetate-CoA ligase